MAGTKPRVLLLDEPTKGVDVGASSRFTRSSAPGRCGLACLVVSSDLPEVLALADRILVMREGRVQGRSGRRRRDEEARHAAGDVR